MVCTMLLSATAIIRARHARLTATTVEALLFTRESSYCFHSILAIAILSVCLSVHLSVCHTGGSVKNGAS